MRGRSRCGRWAAASATRSTVQSAAASSRSSSAMRLSTEPTLGDVTAAAAARPDGIIVRKMAALICSTAATDGSDCDDVAFFFVALLYCKPRVTNRCEQACPASRADVHRVDAAAAP